jgi:hydroxymethylglutaryl-CoA reductase (NADPH)
MSEQFANVPLQWVGPVKITGPEIDVETELPLATYEQPVFATVNRGARVATASGGIVYAELSAMDNNDSR